MITHQMTLFLCQVCAQFTFPFGTHTLRWNAITTGMGRERACLAPCHCRFGFHLATAGTGRQLWGRRWWYRSAILNLPVSGDFVSELTFFFDCSFLESPPTRLLSSDLVN